MIFCVVPEPMAGELFDKLSEYYAGDANVTVIVDRRHGSRREQIPPVDGLPRTVRDRRRPRVPGELPELATTD